MTPLVPTSQEQWLKRMRMAKASLKRSKPIPAPPVSSRIALNVAPRNLKYVLVTVRWLLSSAKSNETSAICRIGASACPDNSPDGKAAPFGEGRELPVSNFSTPRAVVVQTPT